MGFGSFIPPGLGYNLSSDTTCPFDSTSLTNVSNLNLNLGALLNNGGPTDTHALQPLSPAIDYVPVSVCVDVAGNPVATDQRGASRPAARPATSAPTKWWTMKWRRRVPARRRAWWAGGPWMRRAGHHGH